MTGPLDLRSIHQALAVPTTRAGKENLPEVRSSWASL